MADTTAGRTRPDAMAFVLLTVSLSFSIWIAVWLATGRTSTFHGSGAMMTAIYSGSFGPGAAAAICLLFRAPVPSKNLSLIKEAAFRRKPPLVFPT